MPDAIHDVDGVRVTSVHSPTRECHPDTDTGPGCRVRVSTDGDHRDRRLSLGSLFCCVTGFEPVQATSAYTESPLYSLLLFFDLSIPPWVYFKATAGIRARFRRPRRFGGAPRSPTLDPVDRRTAARL